MQKKFYIFLFVLGIIIITETPLNAQWEGWYWQRAIIIYNSGSALSNYQVKIDLNSSNFNFVNANSDGSDLRVTDSDQKTQISFWIEEWDATRQTAIFWVKVPSIPAGEKTIYLYYGNSSATNVSSGESTFILFDDNWAINSLNPVQVATQSWWEATVSYPVVFEDNSFTGRDRFHMLYDGHDVIGHAKGYSTSPDLIHWTSYDNGLTGTNRINPIMGVGYTGNAQFAWGDFIKVGSVFHMYPSQGPGTTVHAQSTDLIHWTGFDALVSDDPSGIGTGVALLKEADGKTPIVIDNKYWMVYFHGFSGGGSMYLAYADITNLLIWTSANNGNPILVPSGWEGSQLWTPSFVRINDTYYIYYQAGSPFRIGFASALATSGGNPVRPDNVSWTKSPNNPVITNTHGWDNGFCQDPVLRYFDGKYYVFYTGDPPWTNGFVYSNSPEGPWIQYGSNEGSGVNWTKIGNPSISNGIINFPAGSAIQSPGTFLPGNAIGFRANFGPQGGSDNRWGGFINGTGGSGSDRAIIQKTPNTYPVNNNVLYLSNYPTYTQLTTLDNQFHVYEVLWNSGRADALIDHGSTSVYNTSYVPSMDLAVTFYNYTGSINPLLLDWVFVRQYSRPEPTITVGLETTNPLPVELSSFSASINGLSVKLNWRTETEVNNYGFEIHRKALDNKKWTTIGFVNGNGNSNSPKSYTFTDQNPTGGSKFQYRLKQIDNDGQFEYSDVVEVILTPTNCELYQNYPNPFNPTTKIRFALPEAGKVSLKIYNMTGEEVAEIINKDYDAGFYDIELNVSNFASGVYIYRLQSNNFTSVKKLIVLK